MDRKGVKFRPSPSGWREKLRDKPLAGLQMRGREWEGLCGKEQFKNGVDSAHFGEILAHLRKGAWVLLPRNAVVKVLHHPLSRAKAVIGDATRKSLIIKGRVDFTPPRWRKIGTGDARGFLKREFRGFLDMQSHTAQRGAVLTVGRKGAVALGPFQGISRKCWQM